jgi:hypothetical protein
MSTRTPRILSAILVATLAAATTSPAQDKPRPANPLHDEMEAIGKAFKQLKTQIGDASKNESSLTLLQEMQRRTLAAKSMTPRGAATRPSDQQASYLLEYRTDMLHMLRLQLELEENLLEGKTDQVAETFKTMVMAMEEAHKEFKPPKRRPQ